jgi:1,4-dihydroxy-2-naphthoyl-CoA synthase
LALGHVLDNGPHLRALGGARRPEDGHNRRAARDMIDVHRRKTAFIVMRIPECELLAAMGRTECVVDVEDLKLAGLHGGAELVNKSCTQSRRFDLAQCILEAGDG